MLAKPLDGVARQLQPPPSRFVPSDGSLLLEVRVEAPPVAVLPPTLVADDPPVRLGALPLPADPAAPPAPPTLGALVLQVPSIQTFPTAHLLSDVQLEPQALPSHW